MGASAHKVRHTCGPAPALYIGYTSAAARPPAARCRAGASGAARSGRARAAEDSVWRGSDVRCAHCTALLVPVVLVAKGCCTRATIHRPPEYARCSDWLCKAAQPAPVCFIVLRSPICSPGPQSAAQDQLASRLRVPGPCARASPSPQPAWARGPPLK